MTPIDDDSGFSSDGLPYRRVGVGARPLVVFAGLSFENRPVSKLLARSFRFVGSDYTVWVLGRRRGMPSGYSLSDMAADCARFVRAHLEGPIDVLGSSTGGSIALHFGAEHGDLVRRLVVHSAAHRLGDVGRATQMRAAEHAEALRWREAYGVMLEGILPRAGLLGALRLPLVRVGSKIGAAADHPEDPSDFVITVHAEDKLAFAERLQEIAAPTLVIAGADDPMYSRALFEETAAGIQGARLVLYPGMGHPARGARFRRDVRAFLRAGPG
jgi:pimeloyl-ACP methyl ester carboxylesterase